MPMNIPVGRMTPKAAAECTKAINPKVVYVYHYDQDFASRAVNPTAKLSDGVNRESPDLGLQEFANELKGTSIEFKRGVVSERGRKRMKGNHEDPKTRRSTHGNSKPRKLYRRRARPERRSAPGAVAVQGYDPSGRGGTSEFRRQSCRLQCKQRSFRHCLEGLAGWSAGFAQ